MKGIVLAGGTGSRLWPITRVVSKQLLPVHDKPMIYYPLSTLMLANIREIMVISTPHDAPLFKQLLGDGSRWGLDFHYAVQPNPGGLAQAFLIGRCFINGDRSALVLGDNILCGDGLMATMRRAANSSTEAVAFARWVREPNRYGVIDFMVDGRVRTILEKPEIPPSNYVLTGLYFYDTEVSNIAATLKPSARGELEITDLNNYYLKQGRLRVETLDLGVAWFDAGTPKSLLQAAKFVAKAEMRNGLKIACPEEIAWRQRWIDDTQLEDLAMSFKGNAYGRYLQNLLRTPQAAPHKGASEPQRPRLSEPEERPTINRSWPRPNAEAGPGESRP